MTSQNLDDNNKAWLFLENTSIFSFISWWRHQMETFSALLAICTGNSPVPGEFPAQRPVTRSFVFLGFFICVWINGWVNNREAGDLRRYDVTVVSVVSLMMLCKSWTSKIDNILISNKCDIFALYDYSNSQ